LLILMNLDQFDWVDKNQLNYNEVNLVWPDHEPGKSNGYE